MISLLRLLFLYVAISQLMLSGIGQNNHDLGEDKVLLSDIKLNDGEAIGKVVTEQDKVDTIVRSLSYLPAEERQRLGIDITASTHIAAGSPEADYIHQIWSQRQQELHKAMEELMKPAELMAELTQKLITDGDGNADYRVEVLHDLEDLLTDVDNARDFHTIGAWPTLVSMLLPSQPISVRTAAAWAVGTAVKNDYSYQLWVLETISHKYPANRKNKSWFNNVMSVAGLGKKSNVDNMRNSSCIELLIDQLEVAPDGSDNKAIAQLRSKALYAISAAMRGNVDVQDSILRITTDNNRNSDPFESVRYFKLTKSIAASGSQHPELTRKIWNALSDLLEERAYVREDLAAHLLQRSTILDTGNSSSVGDTTTLVDSSAADTFITDSEANMSREEAEVHNAEANEALSFLSNLQLMGDLFVTGDSKQQWPVLALETAQTCWEQLKYQLVEFNSKQMAIDRAILQSTLNFLKSLIIQRSALFAEDGAAETAEQLTNMEDKWKPQLKQLVADIIISEAELASRVGDSGADIADENDSKLTLSNEEMFHNAVMEVVDSAKYLHAILSQQQ